jgi:hypothetical protein
MRQTEWEESGERGAVRALFATLHLQAGKEMLALAAEILVDVIKEEAYPPMGTRQSTMRCWSWQATRASC